MIGADALDLYLQALKHSTDASIIGVREPATTVPAAEQLAKDGDGSELPGLGREPGTSSPHRQKVLAASSVFNAAEPPEFAVLCSNIAAVLLKLNRPQEALEYAAAAAQVGDELHSCCSAGPSPLSPRNSWHHEMPVVVDLLHSSHQPFVRIDLYAHFQGSDLHQNSILTLICSLKHSGTSRIS